MPKVLEPYFGIIDHHIRWIWLAAAISLSHNLAPDMFIVHVRRLVPSSPCGSCGLTASLKWTVGRVRPAEQSQADCWLLTVSRSAPCRHSVPAALRPGGAHPLCWRVLSSMFVCCLAFSFAFVWKPAVTRSLGRGSAVHACPSCVSKCKCMKVSQWVTGSLICSHCCLKGQWRSQCIWQYYGNDMRA